MTTEERALELLSAAIMSAKLFYAKKFANCSAQETALDIWFEMKALSIVERQIKIEIEAMKHGTSE